MSGVTGSKRIVGRDAVQHIVDEYIKILKGFPGFVSAIPSGSYVSNLKKKSFGDIDLIVHIDDQRDKKDIKVALVKYLTSLSKDIIVPFVSEKYKGRRFYNSGEIITTSFVAKGHKPCQVDAIIAQSKSEQDFKLEFLNLPAEKQGLVLGLIKTAWIEDKELVTNPLNDNQEFEFNLSSKELQLRKVTYIPNTDYKQEKREIIWSSNDWNKVLNILEKYDLSQSFSNLLKQIKKSFKNPRSSRRLVGVFNSMISIKSGEVGTKKGFDKQKAIDTVNKTFAKETVGVFSGRFQPLTKAHQQIIDRIGKENDKGVVFLVKGKETSKDKEQNPLNKSLQLKLLKTILPENVEVKVIASGFFPDELNLMSNSDFTVYTGTDRVKAYESFVQYMEDDRTLVVKDINRTDKDISSSKVRDALRKGNKRMFQKLTPIEIHPFYEELRNKI